MSTLPEPTPVPLSTGFPFGLDEAWDQTDDGQLTIFAMNPGLIPAHQVARVIYELRIEVGRLNEEVIEAHGLRPVQEAPLCPNCDEPMTGEHGAHGAEPCIPE